MISLASLAAALVLTSPAFGSGHAIPVRYTCDGADVSPPLRWTAPPRSTRSFTLHVIDLDTQPQYLHWLVTGIPASVRTLASGSRVGHPARNSFGAVGYGGPCPPSGETHRYLFQLTALAVHGRVLGHARLLGIYTRR